jgi:hypothetical protein
VLRRYRLGLIAFLVVCFSLGATAQSLFPNADSEAVFQKTISSLNKGTITAQEATEVFKDLLEDFEVPSSTGLRVHGPHIWKLSLLAQTAYFHRLTEAAMASLIEAELGREAAASAWAQQLKYANIHKEAKRKLEAALK